VFESVLVESETFPAPVVVAQKLGLGVLQVVSLSNDAVWAVDAVQVHLITTQR
jgi:hypothetical protein